MAKSKTAPKPTAQLLADYSAFPDDQPVTEHYAAARLQKSRAWCQWRRVAGGGPRFLRTPEGKIFYRKADVEAYLAASLTSYNSTSEYADAARP
jgi:hypothetical protein